MSQRQQSTTLRSQGFGIRWMLPRRFSMFTPRGILRSVIFLGTWTLVAACTPTVVIRQLIDNTCVTRKIQLANETVTFFRYLYGPQGQELTIRIGDQGTDLLVPKTLKGDLGAIRKNNKAWDIACNSPAKLVSTKQVK